VTIRGAILKKQNKQLRSSKQRFVLSAISAGILMLYGAHASASVTSPVIGQLLS
jgi:hypothetical protein